LLGVEDYKYGRTALFWDARRNDKSVARLLLEHGVDLEGEDYYSQTPLSVAARAGNEDVVSFLLEKCACIEADDYHSRTAAQWASMNGHVAITRLPGGLAFVKAGNGLQEMGEMAGMVVASNS
jgi:ankyrin repeat protein